MKTGILTIIKNEHLYLDEWIKYHLSIGIDKIYIFEDIGSLSHKDICSKYTNVECKSILSVYNAFDRNNVINIKTEHTDIHGLQIEFFKRCLDYIKKTDNLDWVAYIDSDEFITLENKNSNISDVLKQYNNYNLVILQWLNYNANGHILKPDGDVQLNYNTTCQLYTGKRMASQASCKMMFNMHKWNSKIIRCNMHIPDFPNNSRLCNWCKTDFSTDLNVPVYDKIYIRHYITKSFEEFCVKIFVRGQFCGSKDLNTFFNFNPDISRNDPTVKEILQQYFDKYMSGDLKFIPRISNR